MIKGRVAALVAAWGLAACGGGEPGPRQIAGGAEQRTTQGAVAAAKQGAAAEQYRAAMHAIYLGYFGRPPDPGGLDWYTGNLAAFQAPADLAGLAQAYGSNGGVRDLIDSFGNSAESRAMYGGDNQAFLTAIYANALGRQPDAAGLAYWLDLLNRGAITRGNAVLTIMAGARLSDQAFLSQRTQWSTGFVQALNTPEKAAAYSGNGALAVVRNALAAATDVQSLPIDYFQRLVDTLLALPRPVTNAPPTVAAIVPALLSQGTQADGSRVLGLAAGRLQVAAQRTTGGVTELVADSGDGKISLALAASGVAMLTDPVNKLSILAEPGPKGTLVRVYDDAARYQAGYFIETGAGGRRTLWRLIADGSTEPSNLTAGRVLPGLARAVQGGPRTRQGDEFTCHGFISGITGGMSDYTNDMGDALDEDGRSAAERRVGRGAKFLGNLYERIASLCPDAPDPVSDAEFARETALESIKAIDIKGGWRKAVEEFQRWRDMEDTIRERATALRNALQGLANSLGSSAGSGLRVPWQLGQGTLSTAPAAGIEQQLQVSKPAIIYVSGSISCVDTQFVGENAMFTNQCGIPVTVSWCFSNGPVCLSNSAADLPVGGSTQSASFGRSTVWSSACPQTVDGRDVHLREEAGSQHFYCYYHSR